MPRGRRGCGWESSRLRGSCSHRLEVALQLPIGHGAFGLPHLPVARARIVVDEPLAQDFARRLRALEHASRFRERARERLAVRVGGAAVTGVALDGGGRLDLVFDAVEARGET